MTDLVVLKPQIPSRMPLDMRSLSLMRIKLRFCLDWMLWRFQEKKNLALSSCSFQMLPAFLGSWSHHPNYCSTVTVASVFLL